MSSAQAEQQSTHSAMSASTSGNQPKIKQQDELTANFTGVVSNVPYNSEEPVTGPMKIRKTIDPNASASIPVQSSPLLSSTPPVVSKCLIKAYPFLIYANKILAILTWTDENPFLPASVVLSSILTILYFEQIITYFGHLLPVLFLALFSLSCGFVEGQQQEHPTLDDVVHCLSTLASQSERLLLPVTSLNLSAYDLKRLLFTTVFLSPAYVIISYFILTPRTMLCAASIFLLTYHSPWSRVSRRLLWRSKTLRMVCFYVTGLDFDQQGAKSSLFKYAMRKTNKKLKEVTRKATGGGKKGAVRFTYVLYENQRRWLGVGWTPNLLSYERTPWTDEFLNEAESPDNFELPQLEDDSGMHWRWVDKTWRVDLTNDGGIQLPSTKSRTTADPKPDEGFIYFDNTWRNPTTEDSFSKYTRRRRWVRTAELIPLADDQLYDEEGEATGEEEGEVDESAVGKAVGKVSRKTSGRTSGEISGKTSGKALETDAGVGHVRRRSAHFAEQDVESEPANQPSKVKFAGVVTRKGSQNALNQTEGEQSKAEEGDTAQLSNDDMRLRAESVSAVQNVSAEGDISTSSTKAKRRKSLRLDTEPSVMGEADNTEESHSKKDD